MNRVLGSLLLLATVARSADNIHNVTNRWDVFWQLADLDAQFPNKSGSVYLGSQNYTWCCLKAVYVGLDILNGTLVIANNSITKIGTSTTGDLRDAALRKNEGSPEAQAHLGGAPEVQVQYAWFIDNCPGWSLSDKSNLNAWLHSLSGFLLPAVVFCLSVPRRRKLHVYRALFVADIAGIKSIIPAIIGAILAGIIVTVDTIIWLSICFAFAGPMILSGLYEALLDNRVLEFLRDKIQNKRLTLDMRCRCLMLVLIGNLDLALDRETLEWGRQAYISAVSAIPLENGHVSHQDHTAQGEFMIGSTPQEDRTVENRDIQLGSLAHREQTSPQTVANSTSMDTEPPNQSIRRRSSAPQPNANNAVSTQAFPRHSTGHLTASPWRHMETLLYDLRLYDDDNVSRGQSPRQWARHNCSNRLCDRREHIQEPWPRSRETERCIVRTKTRLRTMLHCQYSFGSIVGAPVIFFLGGFIFSFLTSLDELGDENIAESIAFGSWYMIIPHIAIISGLLLAGNNPNILEGVLATERDPEDPEDPTYVFGFLRFDLVYPSCYKVAWQWLRGHTKKQWIEQLLTVYSRRTDVEYRGHEDIDGDMKDLRFRTTLSLLDWFVLLFLTLLLVGIPYLFAFMLAFFTPQIGLSCRSLTFLVYFGLQLAQIGLWLWAYIGAPGDVTNPKRRIRALDIFRKGGWLDHRKFYDPSTAPWHEDTHSPSSKLADFLAHASKPGSWTLHTFWSSLYYSLQIIFGLSAVFVSLGGTLMQIMGVYRTNMCFVNVHYWLEPKERRPPVVLSVNSREMINSATKYWKPVAIAAIAFMAVVSFVGWWYQRRMRDVFGQLVKKIDKVEFEREWPFRPRPALGTMTNGAIDGQQN
ncbi:uncharacterized protein CCOS01_15819 [Colletotrichum costaricense]|uniref:Uncharacterized protein n=1 Tax=Colletotrichum costaricense TaxID=1209916 RepID=A0AAI9YGM7_9PEZI|nr:uncharacterized protein CCOS01_15819 [Colletotrichum costaricense]KAK1508158.1 hypothetical protein CCOS01_15819 [Colletotrichum costaricense]